MCVCVCVCVCVCIGQPTVVSMDARVGGSYKQGL